MPASQILSPWRDIVVEAVRSDGPDLSMRQWAILLTVYLNPGPHTVRSLSRELSVPKPAISRALDALSMLNYLRRVRDESDKRIVLLQKTAEGALYLDGFARLIDERMQPPPLSALYG